MLAELGVVEQRFQAVLEVLGGAAVTDVARRYGVARQTVHRWLRRYAESGVSGLVDESSRPHTCPHQMPAQTEARVVEMRWAHPGWGPRTIAYHLAEEAVSPVPSRSAIYRALLRHNLVNRKRRRKPRSAYKRWERSRAMELWQMDVMGGVRLSGDREAKVVTGIDDHSRFCVSAMVVPRATAKPVCDALAAAMRCHGVPDQILTDNGKVFTGRFGPGNGEVLFDRILRENGIDHLLTAPRSPTTTGKVERFHKTLRGEFLTGRVFDSVEEAQGELDGWVEHYNTARPHQGIGMVPPIRRFELVVSEPFEPAAVSDEEPPPQPAPTDGGRRVTRKVGAGGRISLAGHKYHVGRWLAGETVDVTIRDGLVDVSHRDILVVSHARQHRVEDEPAVWQREPRARPVRPETVGVPVTRKVDSSGSISFAAANYRAGNALRGQQVEVRVVGDTVEISADGRIIRSHPIKHDPAKEHGAFANPDGRPRRINAASQPAASVAQVPEPTRNTGTET
ncbi:MAG: IS481 family transposase [Acidobacteria bacterium]|nr:IS481 family transposase [Acidobacteriota bacterium]